MQANSRARSNNPTPGRLRWPKNHARPETVREIPPRPRKDAQAREEQHCDSATGRELAKLRVQLRCLQHEFELEILRRQEARSAQRESEEAHALEVESLRLAAQQAETRARHARVLAEIRERETLRRCHLATTAMVLARCELASLRERAARTMTKTGEYRVASKYSHVCHENDDDKHEKQENKQGRSLELVTSSPSSVEKPSLRRNRAAKECTGKMEHQQWHERETRYHDEIDALRSRARHAERELIAIHQDLCHARGRILMLESTSGDSCRVEKQHSQGKQVVHHDGKAPLLLVARRNPEQENSHDNDIRVCLGGRVHAGNLLEEFVCTKREVRVLREALAHAEESKLRAEDRATAAEKRARRAERRSSRISAASDFVKQEARAVFAALRQRDAHLSDLVDFTLQDL